MAETTQDGVLAMTEETDKSSCLEERSKEELLQEIQKLRQENAELRSRLQGVEDAAGVLQANDENHRRHSESAQQTEKALEEEVARLFACIAEEERVMGLQQKEVDALRRRLLEADQQINTMLKTKQDQTQRLHLSRSTTKDLMEQLDQKGKYAWRRKQRTLDLGTLMPSTVQSTFPEISSGKATIASARGDRPLQMGFERALHLSIQVMPGAMVVGGPNLQEEVQLQVPAAAYVADVKRQLTEAGFHWGPLLPRDGGPADIALDQTIEAARMLFLGMPLKLDVPLKEQGVQDGSKLRLLRARNPRERLRGRGSSEGTWFAPRGLLMNPGMMPWKSYQDIDNDLAGSAIHAKREKLRSDLIR